MLRPFEKPDELTRDQALRGAIVSGLIFLAVLAAWVLL